MGDFLIMLVFFLILVCSVFMTMFISSVYGNKKPIKVIWKFGVSLVILSFDYELFHSVVFEEPMFTIRPFLYLSIIISAIGIVLIFVSAIYNIKKSS